MRAISPASAGHGRAHADIGHAADPTGSAAAVLPPAPDACAARPSVMSSGSLSALATNQPPTANTTPSTIIVMPMLTPCVANLVMIVTAPAALASPQNHAVKRRPYARAVAAQHEADEQQNDAGPDLLGVRRERADADEHRRDTDHDERQRRRRGVRCGRGTRRSGSRRSRRSTTPQRSSRCRRTGRVVDAAGGRADHRRADRLRLSGPALPTAYSHSEERARPR